MAIDFPNSPSLNQTFTVGNRTWIYDGTAWNVYNNLTAETLPGTTLNSNITGSSLTSVGTLTSLNVNGTATVRAASTQDGVALAGRAGGSSSYEVTLQPTTLSADRTLTLPNESGTVVSTATVDPSGATTNQVLKFNGTKFVAGTGSSVTVSDSAPSSPATGDMWFKSDVGALLVYYDATWVEIAVPSYGALSGGSP